MKTKLTLLFTAAFFLMNICAEAQKIEPKKKVEEKTTKRVDKKIDKGIDKGLDKLEEGLGGLFGKKKKKKNEQENQAAQINEQAINANAQHAKLTASHLTPDLSQFVVTYTLDLFPEVIRLFIQHTYPYPTPRILTYEPTTAFSGIVIFMKGLYPVHGEQNSTSLNPALFPKIFDTNMRLVLEKDMMDPSVLKNWGVVAYTDSLNEKLFTDRIGFTPLRIKAAGIFGKQYTDIIIPLEAARKILYSPQNRKLLTEGKILVICDLPQE